LDRILPLRRYDRDSAGADAMKVKIEAGARVVRSEVGVDSVPL